ncbi:MAG: ATP-binding cassette domain-containing protein [Steroidobacteraceae bacterium]
MIDFNDIAIRRGPRVLFSAATFSLFRGEKTGITGENGAGKSTLMELVRGELTPDAGTFRMPPNLAVAHVSQDLHATDQPAIEFVLDGDAELRAVERAIEAELAHPHGDGVKLGELYGRLAEIGGYDARSRAATLMHGLGFDPSDDEKPIRAFSGGWRVRINVAQALMCRSDLLLLDEPTNHLDIDAILWLENWLREYPGTLMLIAHDRDFLDRVCDRIVNIEHGKATAYRGNYSAFETQRAAELAVQSSLFARQQREIRHMESFVARFRASASKARQAQSRLKALERMQRIAPAHVDSSTFEFAFAEPDKLPRPLLVIEEQGAGYGDRTLLEGVSFTISPGDRIALLGKNGAGKSTVMKLLAGDISARGGRRTEARDLTPGYFAQHHLEQLKANESPLQNLRRIGGQRAARMGEADLRDFLAGFGFRGDRVFEAVEPFSGGEKARLMLGLVTFLRPNLLLLDEPTNHLDLEMRQALAVALQDYPGAVVLVSHDRHLLNSVADQFYVVHHGHAEPFDGDLEDYAKWLANGAGATLSAEVPAAAWAAATRAPEPKSVAKQAPAKEPPAQEAVEETAAARPAESADARRDRKRNEAADRARLAPLRAAVERAEKDMTQLAQQSAQLESELTAPELYQPAGKAQLQKLLARQTELKRKIQQTEDRWLAASAELEAAAGG